MSESRREAFAEEARSFLQRWKAEGVPPRWTLLKEADDLEERRQALGAQGLWSFSPVLLTATLDDGWGHGLEVIHRFAEVLGVRIIPLGTLQTPQAIVDRCYEHLPDLVGLTVLQMDSEEGLAFVARHLPPSTRLMAGGPPFAIDPELASRTGVHCAARHAGDFLEAVLSWFPPDV